MDRIELKNGSCITLTDSAGSCHTYTIKDLLSKQGTTCLCYIAADQAGNEVILKEFYPAHSNLPRRDLELDITSLGEGQPELFCRGIENLKIASNIDGLQSFLCSGAKDVSLLKGNGTWYYTSKREPGDSLKAIASDPDTYPEQVLEVFSGVADFLMILHDHEYAYPDLKPEDIWIRNESETGKYQYHCPVFYDFDAMVRFGEYDRVAATYGPFSYNQKSYLVDRSSENKTLAAVLESVTIYNKKMTLSRMVRMKIRGLTDRLRDNNSILTGDDTKRSIQALIQAIRTERDQMKKQNYMKDLRLLKWTLRITCLLVTAIYLVIGFGLLSLFFYAEGSFRLMTVHIDIIWLLLGNVLLVFTILILLRKIHFYNMQMDYEDTITADREGK